MLPSFLLLVFLTLSASSQGPKPFLRTSQLTGDNEESSLITQRMLQGEPVLTSVHHTTFRPPPGPPGPGNRPRPTVVTTEIYVTDGKNGEEVIIVVEDNLDPLEVIETIENGQPQIANGEDVFISSWWTFEDEETAFENWGQLEAFLGAQYGLATAIGIDVGAGDVPVDIEIIAPEVTESLPPSQGTQNINQDLSTGAISLTDIILNTGVVDWGQYEQEEIDGVDVVKVAQEVEVVEVIELGEEGNILAITKPKCSQVRTCQKVFVRPIGLRNVCKNQLVCPKV